MKGFPKNFFGFSSKTFLQTATKQKSVTRMMVIHVIKGGNFLIKFLFNLIEFLLLIYVNNVNYVNYVENLMLIIITLWINDFVIKHVLIKFN